MSYRACVSFHNTLKREDLAMPGGNIPPILKERRRRSNNKMFTNNDAKGLDDEYIDEHDNCHTCIICL